MGSNIQGSGDETSTRDLMGTEWGVAGERPSKDSCCIGTDPPEAYGVMWGDL